METSKPKYNAGGRVKFKLDNPNIPLQYGTIEGCYYSSYTNKVYYTIRKDDGTHAEVPEELLNVVGEE